jgi:hypothetical protein
MTWSGVQGAGTPFGRWGPGESEISTGAVQAARAWSRSNGDALAMGGSGELEAPPEWRCNGQTLRWREIRFDTGEAPQAGGMQRGRAAGRLAKMVL